MTSPDRRSIPKTSDLPYKDAELSVHELETQTFHSQIRHEEMASKHRRDERTRDILSRGIRVIVIVGLGLITAAMVAVASHYLLPESWGWLTENQISEIKTLASGSVFAIFLSKLREYI